MMGEAVAVLRRSGTGTDGMGEPTYEWSAETVEGCLVKPSGGSDAAEAGRPDAVSVSVSVALPKSYTAGKPPTYFEHARVALTSRGMGASDPEGALRVRGCPMRTVPCPTPWDTVLSCGRADG